MSRSNLKSLRGNPKDVESKASFRGTAEHLSGCKFAILALWLWGQGLTATAQTNSALPPTNAAAPGKSNSVSSNAVDPNTAALGIRAEKIRSECIAGRRFICGRVLDVKKDGLVVESGYTSLMREAFNRSWVVTGNVAATLEPHAVEANVPGTVAYGTVFLTGAPKRPAVHKYDYVLLLAYPAGQYEYVPVEPVKKTIRKFAGTIELAVDLRLDAGEK